MDVFVDVIRIKGARQHNLKDVDLDIPKNQLVVVTGPSGSGKSSLAFHTLYAEGQRRYVESLSTYARQFLDQLEKPDVDSIEGLSPAVAIDQRGGSGNPRSIIATSTEIHDYLRILWSAAGIPHDPETGERLEKMGTIEIVDTLMKREEAKIVLLAPVPMELWSDGVRLLEDLQRQGFIRVRVNGEIIDIDSAGESWPEKVENFEVVVDRLVVREGGQDRLADSVETALRICGAETRALVQERGADGWEELSFATAYRNPTNGFELEELTPKSFSFNSHSGACQACHGLGTETFCDPGLIIPDRSKSLKEGAVAIWRAPKGKLSWQHKQVFSLARHFGIAEDQPLESLSEEFQQALLYGTGDKEVDILWEKDGDSRTFRRPFEGLCPQADRLYRETTSDGVKRNLSAYMASRQCVLCSGARLRREMLAVKMPHQSADWLGIHEFCDLSMVAARDWIEGIVLPEGREEVLGRVLYEIQSRLGFLSDVGLEYLTLSRATNSLSGGECQRIRLASQLGAGLSGVLYVLDEPSIGLHQEDNARLIETLKRLRDLGNTVVVVEHDEEMIREADWVVDVGPCAGLQGGEIVAQGTPDEIQEIKESPTGRWLRGEERFVLESRPNGSGEGELVIRGAREHNLNDLTVSIPLRRLVCVTGPSGSGKSTLIDKILRRSLQRQLHRSRAVPGEHDSIEGVEQIDRVVVVDQSSLGTSPRSNAATYTGIMDHLRELYAQLPLSKQRGYKVGRFSFNVKGGRCEKCQGAGQIKIDMHFLADAYVGCDLCNGKRYNRETLDVRFKGHSISDILSMTVNQALTVLSSVPKIRRILESLGDVGLGYLHLGQPANTLSGGEAQRVKLATELSKSSPGQVLYILDEPTTGLHYWDVVTLIKVLLRLRDEGHSLLIIEHNLDVIAVSDWVIDLGPHGGVDGGNLVAEGRPEDISQIPESATGRWLAAKK